MKPLGWVALLVAAFTFIGGAAYGFTLLTSPAQVSAPVATCSPRTVAAGEPVTPNLITVDVYNASRTAGLANRISIELQRRNFLAGNVANNPTEIVTDDIVILAADGKDPRVRLVQAQFSGKIQIVPQPLPDSDNVQVLVGKNWAERSLKKEAAVTLGSDREFTVCLPIVPAA